MTGPATRTNLPHTTHLDGFPPTVTIVRRRHPLEGQALQVLGWMRRHGTLGLILVLPDGTRRLVPAAWTDLEPTAIAQAQPRETLGALADLLNAGRVLAALARRLENRPDDEGHPVEEGARAAASGPVGKPGALAHVWNGLPDEERVAVVVALARLIAQAAVPLEPDVDE